MDLDTAILSFSQWEQPWEFGDTVASRLSPTDKMRFNAILEFANKQENWKHHDLEECCIKAGTNLKSAFVDVKDESIVAIVRAVSYQWR
mgnify:CR=1 FL=1